MTRAMHHAFRFTLALASLAILAAPADSGGQVTATPPAPARTAQATSARTVRYEIAFPNAAHHEGEVTATFGALPPGSLALRMSRSSPGRYALHEFAKNVYSVRATDSKGRELRIERPNPHQWNVHGHDGTVRLTYTLYGDRADGTYAGIDRSMAHLNGPATYMWAMGLERRPVRVTFRLPDPSWTVATQLFPTGDSATFTAPNLQYLMDSPTHLGKQSWHSWEVSSNGRRQTFRIALHHLGTAAEESTYVERTRRIVEEGGKVFGAFPDFDGGSYTFLSTYLPWASGDGMEHRNSTSLTSSGSLERSMNALLGTVSHEFFHAWNVERIRPRSLEPFSFSEANMSGELWLAEGFTSYYAPLLMRRAGIQTVEDFGNAMAGAVNLAMNAPGRRFFSAVEMSQQAPFTDAAVSIDPQNKANTFISYYPFGQAIGLALDLELRQRGKSLDDFMREMWRAHGAQRDFAPVRPYTMADVHAALARVAGDRAFADDFLGRYVEGKEAPPYAELLAAGGFRLRKSLAGKGWLGDVALRYDEGKAIVTANTYIGTPLYEAGVDRGDRIVSLGGRAVTTADDWTAAVASHGVGDVVALVYESRGRTIEGRVTFGESPRIEIVPFEKSGEAVTPAITAFRRRWLGE